MLCEVILSLWVLILFVEEFVKGVGVFVVLLFV